MADKEKLKNLKEFYKKGDLDPIYEMGINSIKKGYGKKNVSAISILKKSAQKGHINSCLKLGELFENNENYVLSVFWKLKAKELGYVNPDYEYIIKDDDEFIKVYSDNKKAYFLLPSCFEKVVGVWLNKTSCLVVKFEERSNMENCWRFAYNPEVERYNSFNTYFLINEFNQRNKDEKYHSENFKTEQTIEGKVEKLSFLHYKKCEGAFSNSYNCFIHFLHYTYWLEIIVIDDKDSEKLKPIVDKIMDSLVADFEQDKKDEEEEEIYRSTLEERKKALADMYKRVDEEREPEKNKNKNKEDNELD